MTHLQDQVDELDLLESVFSSPGEFEIEDRCSHDQALRYLSDSAPHPPKTLSCILNIPINPHQDSEEDEDDDDGGASGGGQCAESSYIISISIRLMESYPDDPPEVYAHANELKRTLQDKLNQNIQDFIKTLPEKEACLLPIVEWIRDNAYSFFPVPCHPGLKPDGDGGGGPDSHFCRMWLYMHHIYSKTKRRNILSLADELHLTGFTLPGKPGVVCVEGTVATTREFYAALRRWNWKSIACKRRDVEPSSSGDLKSLRKIEGYRELCFDIHGNRNAHMDMGQFLGYLREHTLEYMFKELFGVEGHPT